MGYLPPPPPMIETTCLDSMEREYVSAAPDKQYRRQSTPTLPRYSPASVIKEAATGYWLLVGLALAALANVAYWVQ